MKKTFLIFTVYCLLSTAVPALAETEYTLLQAIPIEESGCVGGGGETCKTNAGQYIGGIFTLFIGIAGALAVVMIIWGGIKYMSTDAIGGKNEARETIQNAIWGLLLALGAWIILNTINPKLVNFDLRIERPPSGPSAVGAVGAVGCPTCLSLTESSIPTKPGIGTTVAGSLQPKLIELNTRLGGTGWQVTEAYPPTTTHQNACHTTGTCIDANVTSPTPTNINAFARAAQQSGLNPVYEVSTQAEKDTLIGSGVTARIDVEPRITAPHFSVYSQ